MEISVIRRIQTGMTDRCMVERGEKGIRPPPVETKILEVLAGPKAQEIGLHPAPVGSRPARKIPMATLEAEIEIQAKPLNPVQTKEMLKDSRVKVREILREPLLLVRAEGVAPLEVHHPAAVAVDVERATIVWIRSQVQIRCPMRIEIMSKMP